MITNNMPMPIVLTSNCNSNMPKEFWINQRDRV